MKTNDDPTNPAHFSKSGTVVCSALVALLLTVALAAGPVNAGIPEPDLVWYGKVLAVSGGGATVRLTTGNLTWQITPPGGGTPWVLSTPLTNINDQFSFVLRVPCESPEPGGTASANTVVLASPANTYGRVTVSLDGQPLTLAVVPATFSPTLTDRGRAERIDLNLGTGLIDSDGDGMSDAWENQYFGAGGANPNDDFDNDGLSNLREFRAGTNPKDALSVFEVMEVTPVAGGLRLRWSSVAGKIYKVRRSASVLAAPASYGVLQSGIAATPPLNELTDTTVAGGDLFFYLIETQ